jgi:hypothetical protein
LMGVHFFGDGFPFLPKRPITFNSRLQLGGVCRFPGLRVRQSQTPLLPGRRGTLRGDGCRVARINQQKLREEEAAGRRCSSDPEVRGDRFIHPFLFKWSYRDDLCKTLRQVGLAGACHGDTSPGRLFPRPVWCHKMSTNGRDRGNTLEISLRRKT